ncbi:MAG: ATP synthase F1 subunit epsilon [Crocinitomicaceae bacterium]|nr:ATP synthase F1 subunit epsilon [Crocinitomicaceae bacterium]
MTVHILTPDETLFSGDAVYVGLPGSDGSMGIMDRHAALITTLQSGDVLVRTNKDEQTFAVKGGTVEVLNNVVTVLAA